MIVKTSLLIEVGFRISDAKILEIPNLSSNSISDYILWCIASL